MSKGQKSNNAEIVTTIKADNSYNMLNSYTKKISARADLFSFLFDCQTHKICNMLKNLDEEIFYNRLNKLDATKNGFVKIKNSNKADNYNLLRQDAINYAIKNNLQVLIAWQLTR